MLTNSLCVAHGAALLCPAQVPPTLYRIILQLPVFKSQFKSTKLIGLLNLEILAPRRKMQLTSDQEQLDRENHLASIGDVEVQVARRVLRKFKGDMEKAVDAILSGDRAMDADWESQRRNTPEPMYTDTSKAVLPSTSVIDLTADDEDMTRAIQMSMETSQTLPHFGPTERAPHPEWQMVRSNVMCISWVAT